MLHPRPALRGREAPGPQPRHASPSPASGSSSTSGSARAAATAATRATACRCSRSTRRTGARRASTRRAATSTCRACRATARRSPPSPSTTTRPKRGTPDGRARPAIPAPGCPTPAPVVPDRQLHRAPLGHRRHRRDHRQPGPRHGGDARRATSCAASTRPACRRRPGRSSATCASAAATVAGVEPRQQLRRRLPAGVRPARRGQRHPPRRRRPRPHGRHRVGRRRRRPARWSPTRRRRTPSSTRSPAASTRCRGRAQPLRRRRGARRPGCSATPRRPTSCCSASPCRPGAIAVDPARIERAIELNGVAVERNVAAFRWGRRWAAIPTEVEQAAGHRRAVRPETLDELIDRLAADLVDYQSRALRRALPSTSSSVARDGRAARRPGEHARSPRPSPATATS